MTMTVAERRRAEARSAITDRSGLDRDMLKDLTKVGREDIPLRFLVPDPDQPRLEIDETGTEFLDLVGTIREHGLLQPISVRELEPGGDARYMIIAGERRYRAYLHLAEQDPNEFGRIPAMVIRIVGQNKEAQVLMKQLIENAVRVDVAEGERAFAFQRLKTMSGWTWEQVAAAMGMNTTRVIALASIARFPSVVQAVDAGDLSTHQGIAIGQAAGDEHTAAALVGAVQSTNTTSGLRNEKTLRKVAKKARAMDLDIPPTERVATAIALVGADPSPMREEEFEVRANGETTVVSRSVVVLGNTSLRTIRPRSTDMDREAFIEMMRRTCQETSVWVIPTPEQVETAGIDRSDLVALAEAVCRAAEHFPTP